MATKIQYEMKEMFALQWYFVCGVTVLTLLTHLATASTTQQRGTDEICETLPSEIHLIKGKHIANRGYYIETALKHIVTGISGVKTINEKFKQPRKTTKPPEMTLKLLKSLGLSLNHFRTV